MAVTDNSVGPMYLKTGDNAVDGNRHCLDVVGHIDEVRRKVSIINDVDSSNGCCFTASCDVLMYETFSWPTACLQALCQFERQCHVIVCLLTALLT